MLEALRRSLDEPATLNAYPDLELTDLRSSIAAHLKLGDASRVAIANGFVPLLEAAVRALSLTRTLLPVPAFTEYRTTLERCGVAVTAYRLQARSFAYDRDDLSGRLEATGADSLVLANPQNPSGVLTPVSVVVELIHRHPGVQFLVDEAFIDYTPQQTLAPYLAELANLIVFRSVTKFFAMPGLRVAYAAGASEEMASVRRHLAPWPVSTLAAHAVTAALEDTAYAQTAIALNEGTAGGACPGSGGNRDLEHRSLGELSALATALCGGRSVAPSDREALDSVAALR